MLDTKNDKKYKTCRKATFFDDLIPGLFRQDQYSSFNCDDQKKNIEIEFRCVDYHSTKDGEFLNTFNDPVQEANMF